MEQGNKGTRLDVRSERRAWALLEALAGRSPGSKATEITEITEVTEKYRENDYLHPVIFVD